MAATFCTLSPGSGLKKLDDFPPKQKFFKRSYLGSESSSIFFCCAQNFLHSTYRRQLKAIQWNHRPRAFIENQADTFSTTHEEHEEENISQATLIWRAVKLPIYSVALIPLTVGSAAAYLQTGVFSAGRYFGLLGSSVLVIAWLNLSNDAYDFDTGADKNKKESVVNLVGRDPRSCILITCSWLHVADLDIHTGGK